MTRCTTCGAERPEVEVATHEGHCTQCWHDLSPRKRCYGGHRGRRPRNAHPTERYVYTCTGEVV